MLIILKTIKTLEKKRKYFHHKESFKDTVVNQTLASLHGGSLKIKLTVPLKQIFG